MTAAVGPSSATLSAGMPLSRKASTLLAWADAVRGSREASQVDDLDVVMGALLAARGGLGSASAEALYLALPDPAGLEGALAAAGVHHAPADRARLDPSATGGPAGERAAAIAQFVGRVPELAARHLLAGALTGAPLPAALTAALGVDDAALRDRLRDHVAAAVPEESPEAWAAVLADPGIELTSRFASDLVPARSRTNGIPRAELADRLGGFEVYVGMLATLIARKSTALPLSIGVFGEWGSGKSYFMELLRQRVDQLRTGPADGPYHTEILQIHFNAWHYADTNLWASLSAEFFDQLGQQDTDPVEARRTRLREDLVKAQHSRTVLENSVQHARVRTAALRHDVVEARERAERARRRFDLALLKAVADDKTIRADVEQLADRLGVDDDERERVLEIAHDVRATGDDLRTVGQVAARRSAMWPLVLLLLVTAALALAKVAPASWVEWLHGGAIASVTALLAGAAIVMKQGRTLVGRLRDLADRAEEVEARIRDDPERNKELTDLMKQVSEAEADEAVARTQEEEVLARIAEIDRQLDELRPGRRLDDFLAERAASSDYRGRLGVISLVRRDFEQLVLLMDAWRREGDASRRPIDRIVLYIDDLDRCEPDQVVTVLQAVHLLLAMDLFTVVVGVDPNWLLRSVSTRYRRLLDDRIGDSTSLRYLEKIFQVPFVLPEMDEAGFGKLIEHLAALPDLGALPVASAPGDDPAAVPVEIGSEVASVLRGRRPQTLPLTGAELALLQCFGELLRTPRAATRLFNLYGLVRSTRNLEPDSGRFLGSPGQPGEYQVVAQLLAVACGAPRTFDSLLRGARPDGQASGPCGESWFDFVDKLDPVSLNGSVGNCVAERLTPAEAQEWRRVVKSIRAVRSQVTLDDIERYQEWGPRISRFSFALPEPRDRSPSES